MKNHYFAIDVETANADYSSICQIGVAEFENGNILRTWKSYVNPEQCFDQFFVNVHGIDHDTVKDAPKIPEVLEQLSMMVSNHRLVHHMPFDKCALNRACENYLIDYLPVTWIDSAKIVRRNWTEYSQKGYGLGNITRHLGISYRAHDALEDAISAGKVVYEAIRQSGKSIEDWESLMCRPITPRTYNGKSVSYKMEGNQDGPLYGESVVFTGTLSQPRSEMAVIAAEAGCRVQDGVNHQTTLLVVGFQTEYRLNGYDKSSKQRKAEQMVGKGFDIKIVSEDDFRWMADLGG
ncbi:exonuclease domain-containing protein [Aquiflexum sp.]|uniref:exonuclease domain-containing protein n=1 Tax=Aquiflexum sp. TaxID=1872584 RepID=UPI0035937691